jgi:TRAP-type C4-dicarboxylate transport system permease large subunit
VRVVAGGTPGILIPVSDVDGCPRATDPETPAAKLILGRRRSTSDHALLVATSSPAGTGVTTRATGRAARAALWHGSVHPFRCPIGGIYAGWFSPTEAAAVGTFATIVLATLTGQLTLRQLADSVIESSRTTAMLFFILLGAIMFSYFIVQTQIATNLATWVVSLHLPPTAVMIVVVFSM